MTVLAPTTAPAPATGGARRRQASRAGVAVARRTFRQLWKQALVVALVCGATAASSAVTYAQTYPDAATRRVIADSLRGDAGFSVLLGPVDALDTIGGYTTYKTYVFLTTVVAIWGALAATRLLRGEEDAGRWQLVLAGRTGPARATLAVLAALGGAVAVVFAGTTLFTLAAGAAPDMGFTLGGMLLFGLSIALAGAMFMAVGAVCSQLAQTRRLATGLSMAAVAVAFLLRMLADAGPGEHWLLWTTPFGWIQLMRPLTANDVVPVLPALAFTAAGVVLAAGLAARRDAGGGLLATDQSRPPRAFGLRGPVALAGRLGLPVFVAWAAGIAGTAFVMGIIGRAASNALPEGSSAILDRLGAGGTAVMLLRYYGVVFLLLAALLAVVPASHIGPAREDEATGRLHLVLAGRPTRTAWFAGRLGLAALAVVVLGVLAGAAGWLGGATQGLGLDPATMLVAGLNIVPVALVVLGIGAVVLAVAPRLAVGSVYAVVAWSFCVQLLTSLVSGLSALDRLSLFHYLTLAPAQDPDWSTLALTTVIAVALAVVAVVLFARRDLSRD